MKNRCGAFVLFLVYFFAGKLRTANTQGQMQSKFLATGGSFDIVCTCVKNNGLDC